MKVICKENRASNIDFKAVNIIYHKETEFPVIKGKEYIIMGIVIYKDSNCIYYLVDDYDGPCWLPYILFDISDNELSLEWYMKVFGTIDDVSVDLYHLAGFSELCNNEDYYDALTEEEPWALDIYFKRKREMQEWYELKPFMSKE